MYIVDDSDVNELIASVQATIDAQTAIDVESKERLCKKIHRASARALRIAAAIQPQTLTAESQRAHRAIIAQALISRALCEPAVIRLLETAIAASGSPMNDAEVASWLKGLIDDGFGRPEKLNPAKGE